MIINSDELENNNIFKADLCIAGSGPASLTIVKDMQQAGLNIIVLSGGEYKVTNKNQNLYKGFVKPKNSHEPLDKYRYRVFGGSGNLQKKNSKKEIKYLIKQDIKSFNSIAHHLGATRMSKSHTSGVVDKNCKVFGLKNLFIAGSSVFSTAGHANPTFTIVALSLKLSRFLKKIYKKK